MHPFLEAGVKTGSGFCWVGFSITQSLSVVLTWKKDFPESHRNIQNCFRKKCESAAPPCGIMKQVCMRVFWWTLKTLVLHFTYSLFRVFQWIVRRRCERRIFVCTHTHTHTDSHALFVTVTLELQQDRTPRLNSTDLLISHHCEWTGVNVSEWINY